MAEKCIYKAGEVLLFPCSGGSSCGQIANQVAVSLEVQGIRRIHYLAGIGTHIDGMVESARGARRIVALDGCDVACAEKTIEHAGLMITDWVCVIERESAKATDSYWMKRSLNSLPGVPKNY